MAKEEKQKHVFMVTYQYGHPNIGGRNIPCFLKLYDKELVVRRRQLFGEEELFRIPYEKIESVTTNIEKEWKGARLATGLVLLGPLGALLFGKKKTEQLGLVVRGQDKEGNVVQIPIVFTPARFSSKIKALVDQEIGRAKGVTI